MGGAAICSFFFLLTGDPLLVVSWPLTNGVCCDVSSDAARAADTTCTIATSDSWTVSGTCSITKVFSSLGNYTCDLRQGVRERGDGGERDGGGGGGVERDLLSHTTNFKKRIC